MVIDEGQRLRMVGRLHEVLGDDVADTLMGYLPPGGWDEVATKSDLSELKSDLRTEMAGLRTELHTEMAGLRTELRTDMAGLKSDLRTEMAELRSDLHTEMADIRTDLHTEMASLRTDLRTEMSGLRETVIRDNRWLLFGMVGVLIAYGAALVAAVRLH